MPVHNGRGFLDLHGAGTFAGVGGAPFRQPAVVGAEVDADAVASECVGDEGGCSRSAEGVSDYCWSEGIATTVRTRECVPNVWIMPLQ